jgi:hypothetical protein
MSLFDPDTDPHKFWLGMYFALVFSAIIWLGLTFLVMFYL